MSIAIVATKNTMGVRTLHGYAIQSVARGPAEPGPRAANHPVRGMMGHAMGAVAPGAFTDATYGVYGGRPANFVRHAITPAEPASAGATSVSSTPSQAPTGAVVSSYTDLSAQMAPSVASIVAPAPNPTAIATVAPASVPGYTVVTSGTTTPDYVQDIETWLTSTDLLASIFPSLSVPNWIPAVAIVGGIAYMMSGKKR